MNCTIVFLAIKEISIISITKDKKEKLSSLNKTVMLRSFPIPVLYHLKLDLILGKKSRACFPCFSQLLWPSREEDLIWTPPILSLINLFPYFIWTPYQKLVLTFSFWKIKSPCKVKALVWSAILDKIKIYFFIGMSTMESFVPQMAALCFCSSGASSHCFLLCEAARKFWKKHFGFYKEGLVFPCHFRELHFYFFWGLGEEGV